jgi:hypothetical protein
MLSFWNQLGWDITNHTPTKSIVSFVGQMMLDNKQSDIAKENGLLPFDLLGIRTLQEPFAKK